MRHIMVDNENVHWKKIPDLGEEPCCLWLFAGALQSSVPTELTADLLELQKQGKHTVRLIQVKQSGENALDFCLSYQMGRIVKDYGADEVSFCVVSKDKGFDTVINHMLSEGHCRHAVRVCTDDALRLNENELREQIAPPQAPTFFNPDKPAQSAWQAPRRPHPHGSDNAAPPPRYQKPDGYQISISAGAGRAWEGLKQHPEARARSRSNLAYRLKEYVLKDWLTYPEPRRSRLVEDIIGRLIAQGSIVQDENGLLEYRMEYTEQLDNWISALYDWIKRRADAKTPRPGQRGGMPPKPPQSLAGLHNWFRAKVGRQAQLGDEDLAHLVQVCVWRGLLSVDEDGRVAYRMLDNGFSKTASGFKPAYTFAPEEHAVCKLAASMQDTFLRRTTGFTPSDITAELLRREAADTVSEYDSLGKNVLNHWLDNGIVAQQGTLLLPQAQTRYDELMAQIRQSIIHIPNRPRTLDKFIRSCLVFRNKFAPLEARHALYVAYLCEAHGDLSVSDNEEREIIYADSKPLVIKLPENETPAQAAATSAEPPPETAPQAISPAEPPEAEAPPQAAAPEAPPKSINSDDIAVLIQKLSERERQQAEAEEEKRAALQAAKAAMDAAKRPPPAPKVKPKPAGEWEDGGEFEAEIHLDSEMPDDRLPPDDGHEWEPQRLLACARRMIDVCSAERLPERDTELIALFERAGLGRQYAQQALFLLIQNGDVAVEAGKNAYCLTYKKA